jgi:hypothetical protein
MQLQRLTDCAVRLAQLMIRLLTVLETMIAMTGNREGARVPRESHYIPKAQAALVRRVGSEHFFHPRSAEPPDLSGQAPEGSAFLPGNKP